MFASEADDWSAQRQSLRERFDHVVGPGVTKLVGREVMARHADAGDAGGGPSLHGARGVADGDRLLRSDLLAIHERRARECDPGELAAVAGVGAIAAEGEE